MILVHVCGLICFLPFCFQGSSRSHRVASEDIKALRIWEINNMLEDRFACSADCISPTQPVWAARGLNLANVVTAKNKMIANLEVPKYMILLSRMSISGTKGMFDLNKACAAKDLRPVSGAHTCAAALELLRELESRKDSSPILLSELRNVNFRVLFVDDVVMFILIVCFHFNSHTCMCFGAWCCVLYSHTCMCFAHYAACA